MGAAGDMLMAALYELLEDKPGFLDVMNGLGLPGVRVEALSASTCGIAGTRMQVTIGGREEHQDAPLRHERADHHGHATLTDVRGHIGALPLPETVKGWAVQVYDKLAAAEAKAHGCPVDQVHFHEVGALDAVADVTGVCYALYLLAPEKIVVSPIHLGRGSVKCAHGVVLVPAPATAVLLEGIPCYGGEIEGELCTPTGAALLSNFGTSFGPMPVMTLKKTGYGVGNKAFSAANCVRAFLGECGEGSGGDIAELTCNLDDMTPEALAFACERLLAGGALDAYTVPGQMKKGRPGWELTVLCEIGCQESVARQIFAHTSTNGVRVKVCGKYVMEPHIERVDTPYGSVRVKYAQGWGARHCKPEYDDVAALADERGIPFDRVWDAIKGQLGETT